MRTSGTLADFSLARQLHTPLRVRLLLALAAACLCAPAAAQVVWNTDEAASVRRAEREDRLLIFFFTYNNDDGDDGADFIDRTRETVRRIFRVPSIAALVRRAFVPVAADFRQNTELRGRLKRVLPNEVVITQPDLTVLARFSAWRPLSAEGVYLTLQDCLERWIAEAYARAVRPTLLDSTAPPAAQRFALRLARRMSLDSSDKDVIALLHHPDLDAGVQTLAFAVLADLATESAVRELMESARESDAASRAITRASERALPVLSRYLDDPRSPDFLTAYRAMAAIARSGRKPDSFWETATAEERSAEIQRIRRVASKRD